MNAARSGKNTSHQEERQQMWLSSSSSSAHSLQVTTEEGLRGHLLLYIDCTMPDRAADLACDLEFSGKFSCEGATCKGEIASGISSFKHL